MNNFQIVSRGDVWMSLDKVAARQLFKKATDALALTIRHWREHVRRQAAAAAYRRACTSLLKEQREAERRNRALWVRTRVRPERCGYATHKPKPTVRMALHFGSRHLAQGTALPRYSGAIIDRNGRRGIFLKVFYYGRATKPGVGKRVTEYIWAGALENLEGQPYFESNVGESIEEAVEALSLIEDVNRAAQKNSKALFHAIANVPYQLRDPELMMEIGREFAEQHFGSSDLPYALALHPPSEEGDQRNWHLHILFSTRPMVRTGAHEWDVGTMLRTEIDNPDAFDRMRHDYASIQTEIARRAGLDFTYTALSNAERGLPNAPQRHLGGKETAKVRRGEFSAVNDRNIEIMMAGEAALLDERLRHGQEQAAAEAVIISQALKGAPQLEPVHIPASSPLAIAGETMLPPDTVIGEMPVRADSPAHVPIGPSHPMGIATDRARILSQSPASPPQQGRAPLVPPTRTSATESRVLSVAPPSLLDSLGLRDISNLKPANLPRQAVRPGFGLTRMDNIGTNPFARISVAAPLKVDAPAAVPLPSAMRVTPWRSSVRPHAGQLSLSTDIPVPQSVPRLARPVVSLKPMGRSTTIGIANVQVIPRQPAPSMPVRVSPMNAARPSAVMSVSLLAPSTPPTKLPAAPVAEQIAAIRQEIAALNRALDHEDAERARRDSTKSQNPATAATPKLPTAPPPRAAVDDITTRADPMIDVPSIARRPAVQRKTQVRPAPSASGETGNSKFQAETDELLAFAARRRKRRAKEWLQATLPHADGQHRQQENRPAQREAPRQSRPVGWRPGIDGQER